MTTEVQPKDPPSGSEPRPPNFVPVTILGLGYAWALGLLPGRREAGQNVEQR